MKTNIKRKIIQTMQKLLSKTIKFSRENGLSFLIYAIIMNFADEIAIPAIIAYFGHPIIAGFTLFGDLDWLTYPLYFLLRNRVKMLVMRSNSIVS